MLVSKPEYLAEVESADGWRKSERSGPYSDNCVEVVGLTDGGVAMRDSKMRGGPVLVYTREEAGAFFAGVKAGEFDDLLAPA